MKNQRQLYFALVILLLGLSGWWRWETHERPEEVPAATKSKGRISTPAQSKVVSTQPMANSTLAGKIDARQYEIALTTSQTAVLREDPSAAARYAKFASIRNETNFGQIDFFGKAVDQDGKPIAGVKVKGSILYIVTPISSANREVVVESNAEGRFEFVGLHGAGFGLLLSKDGYESNGKSDDFAGRKPDSNDPVVFVLWKLRGAEPMVHERSNNGVPYDGRAASFDLLTGKKSEGGDLRVTLERSPLQVRRGVDHFDWNVRIEVAGGGLVEAGEPYPYLAPEAGYQPAFAFGQTKNAPNWTANLIQTFYVRLAGGQYGRVRIDLTTDSDRSETGMRIESWLNPSGSRNLEFDPAKTIKVPPRSRL